MKPLFPLPPAAEHTLTPRQAAALDQLRNHPDGLTAAQLAAHLDLGPVYGPQNARRLLVALKAAGHVTAHRHGLWRARRGVRDGKTDPSTAEWPEGF